jgi:hypothetical protein
METTATPPSLTISDSPVPPALMSPENDPSMTSNGPRRSPIKGIKNDEQHAHWMQRRHVLMPGLESSDDSTCISDVNSDFFCMSFTILYWQIQPRKVKGAISRTFKSSFLFSLFFAHCILTHFIILSFPPSVNNLNLVPSRHSHNPHRQCRSSKPRSDSANVHWSIVHTPQCASASGNLSLARPGTMNPSLYATFSKNLFFLLDFKLSSGNFFSDQTCHAAGIRITSRIVRARLLCLAAPGCRTLATAAPRYGRVCRVGCRRSASLSIDCNQSQSIPRKILWQCQGLFQFFGLRIYF